MVWRKTFRENISNGKSKLEPIFDRTDLEQRLCDRNTWKSVDNYDDDDDDDGDGDDVNKADGDRTDVEQNPRDRNSSKSRSD